MTHPSAPPGVVLRDLKGARKSWSLRKIPFLSYSGPQWLSGLKDWWLNKDHLKRHLTSKRKNHCHPLTAHSISETHHESRAAWNCPYQTPLGPILVVNNPPPTTGCIPSFIDKRCHLPRSMTRHVEIRRTQSPCSQEFKISRRSWLHSRFGTREVFHITKLHVF